MDEALKLFNEMPERGVDRNLVTYTVMISGLSKKGRSDEAFKLYDEMREAGITPDDTAPPSSIDGSIRYLRIRTITIYNIGHLIQGILRLADYEN
ncbi:hypothetical protein RJ639_023470 [Escallonia herrerae]|uniref:Pentatricopeptide repeat-containing protein n=1 Tax=Escallonia herrerae TaxID=1293975 RepID=A0AA88V0C5_9ASTE|nr:hypothetical protein RJ639_023470 [Escallonia herrerae]